MAYDDDYEDIARLLPSLSPVMSAGLDPDEVLASGDANGMLAAKRAGVPYQPKAAQQVPQVGPTSMLAAAADYPRSPIESTKAELTPGQPSGAIGGPGGATQSSPPTSNRGSSLHAAFAPRADNPASTDPGYYLRPNGVPPDSDPAANTQSPATNAPNPPSEPSRPPTVPGTVTPSGNSVPTTQPSPFQRAISGQLSAADKAASLQDDLQNQPSVAATLSPLEQQRAAAAAATPNPMDKQFRPSVGRRIARGVLGAVEGLGRGGIRGAVVGAVDPAAAGGTPYNAPTSRFSPAAQRNAQQIASLDQQIEEGTKAAGADTARLKDTIASIQDVGKGYAGAARSATEEATAQAATQDADTKQQLADVKQQIADYQRNGRTPTTYEATVAAAALEKDPQRRAALQGAAKQMADTEVKKFQYRAQQDGGDRSQFRQSMIDNATQQVQALQDSYTYSPRRNTYVDDKGNELTPKQFTDKKNAIATRLDQQLTTKKLKPLGVRFNPADAGANKPTGRNATAASSTLVLPPASLLAKTPEGHSVVGQNGETFVKRGGQWAQQ
jgi:hypothetical protein